MCATPYDLVCDRCRQLYDQIFAEPAETVEEEERRNREWVSKLCPDCRRVLAEEGFIPSD